MGRPINKRSFGQVIGQSIAIFANIGEGPGQYFIKSQSGTSTYRIGALGSDETVGTVSLVIKETEDLQVGEGVIFAFQGENVFPVTKLLQNRVSVNDEGTIKSFSWKEVDNGVLLLSQEDGEVE